MFTFNVKKKIVFFPILLKSIPDSHKEIENVNSRWYLDDMLSLSVNKDFLPCSMLSMVSLFLCLPSNYQCLTSYILATSNLCLDINLLVRKFHHLFPKITKYQASKLQKNVIIARSITCTYGWSFFVIITALRMNTSQS